MLVVDGNSVYEIDEECIKSRAVSSKCELPAEWLPHAPMDHPIVEKNETKRER